MTGAAARVTRRVTMPDRLPEERQESCHGGRDRLGREAGPATRGHQEPRYSSTSDLRRSKSSSGMLTKTKTGPSLSLRHTMDSTSSGFRSGGGKRSLTRLPAPTLSSSLTLTPWGPTSMVSRLTVRPPGISTATRHDARARGYLRSSAEWPLIRLSFYLEARGKTP